MFGFSAARLKTSNLGLKFEHLMVFTCALLTFVIANSAKSLIAKASHSKFKNSGGTNND